MKGIALLETHARLQALCRNQLPALAHVECAVVAQACVRRAVIAVLERVDHVTTVSCGDVQNLQRLPVSVQPLERAVDQLLQVTFTLADAAPADGVKVMAVDHAPQRPAAGGPVAIHVVKCASRIETGLETQPDAVGKAAGKLQTGTVATPEQTARAQRGQGLREHPRLVEAVAALVVGAQIECCRWLREALEHETPDMCHRLCAVAFAQCVVEEALEDVFFLDWRAQIGKEAMLRPVVHDPVRPRNEHLRRRGDRLRVIDDAPGGVVQAKQHVDRDRARDQRVVVVRRLAHGVARQQLRLDVAIDEEVATQPVHQGQSRARKGHVELDAECRRGEH